METIEVKTAELEGAALDWAVAKAIKWIEPLFGIGAIRYIEADSYLMMETPDPDEPEDITKPSHFNHYVQWSPSRIWSHGGPLIERHRIRFCDLEGQWRAMVGCEDSEIGESHYFDVYAEDFEGAGDTHLIAACRAIVATKLGDTVQVPVELIGATARSKESPVEALRS